MAEPWRSPTRLLSAHFLLQKASNNLLYLSLLTIFLKNAGAESLPWVYVLVNISFIFLQFGLSSKLAGKEGHWLLSALSWPALGFAVTAGAVIQGAGTPVLLAFLIVSILVDLFSSQAFANMANQYLPLQEAKQSLPGIYAAGSLGYILSGILLKFVLDFVGIRGLLWFTALLIIVQQILLGELEPFERASQSREPGSGATGPGAGTPAPESTWSQPLIRLLVVSSFLILFNKYMIDFLFAGAVSNHYPKAQDLAVFLGVFGAAADFTVIALQTLVMNQVFSRYPIGRILTVVPLGLVFLCSGAAISLTFAIVVTIQFFVLINSKNFTVPATSILLSAIRSRERGFYRRDIGIVCSASSMLVGGILLLVRTRLSAGALFAAAAFVYAVMAWVHYRLDKAYAVTIRKTIADNPEAEDADWLESLRFLGARERFTRIRELLTLPDPNLRKGAIGEAALLSPPEIKELLLPLLAEEKDPACLAILARTLIDKLGPDALCNLEILLAGNEDPRLSSDILEALGQVGSGEPVEDLVELFLSHDHHRIRGSAAMSLLRLTRRPERLEAALVVLARMARDPAPLTRATAAAVMGEHALPLFIPALDVLSDDADRTVARNALQALAKMRTSRALAILESRCRHPDAEVAETAQGLFHQASLQGLERIGSLMQGFSGPERQRLAQTLKHLRGERRLELLARSLSLEKPLVREGLVRLLQEADDETIVLLDRCLTETPEGRVGISLDPIWEKVSSFFLRALPRWSQLLPVLALENAEAPDETRRKDAAARLAVVRRVWQEGLAIDRAADILPGAIPPDRVPALRAAWLERAEVCARLLALNSADPSHALRALDQIRSPDPFTRSVAQELLETQFGAELVGWLLPLLRPAPGTEGTDGSGFAGLARDRGLRVETPEERESYRPLLAQIIQVEASA